MVTTACNTLNGQECLRDLIVLIIIIVYSKMKFTLHNIQFPGLRLGYVEKPGSH
jgi:hypothetical protein